MATHSYFPWSVSSLFSICSAPARRTGGTERERKGTKMFSGVCRKKKCFFSWLSAPLRILWTFHPEMFIRLVCCRCILTLGYPLFYPIKKQLVLSSLRGAIRTARALKHQAVVFPPLFSYEANRKRRRIPI